MHLDFDVGVGLPGQSARLSKAALMHQLLLVLVASARSVPNDALHLARALVCTLVASSSKIVASSGCTALPDMMKLLLVQFLEEITFLALVIADVESVASDVLLLPIEVFHDR